MKKDEARKRVWGELKKVARPDSRFHLDFNEFIPDFEGSEHATQRLLELEIYRKSETIFITPDNCLVELRAQTVRDQKVQIVSTHGIRRGLVELHRQDVQEGHEVFAAVLDGMERLGRYISLETLRARYSNIDFLVTGASVVSPSGIRFGKGHGYFDLEWAFLYEIGLVDINTPVIAFVHDCQVVDIDLEANEYDTICDVIVTPSRTIRVEHSHKPEQGVLWGKLAPGMIEEMPILHELKNLIEGS